MRLLSCLGLLLVLTLLAGADGASASLRVLSVSSPPETRQPGKVFVVVGRLENTSARASAPLLSFRLRSLSGRRTYALTPSKLSPLGRDRVRSYRARLRVPATARGGRYRLQACVKRSRRARATCRSARGLLRVVYPPAPPVATGPPPRTNMPTVVPPPAGAPPSRSYTPGARTLGDPLFPTIGNGGYDAQRYALDLAYEPATFALSGTATMTAVATQDLSELSLDLTEWNDVSAVTVDGAPAGFVEPTAADRKLVVTPARGIDAGTTFTVRVTYAGSQEPVIDPDGSSEGWIPRPGGAVVMAEPVGAMGWFPNNNVPTDRATVEIAMSVPDAAEPWDVIGPGELVDVDGGGPRTRWVWDEDAPTPTYLVGLAIWKTDWDPAVPRLENGRPFVNAVSTDILAKAAITANIDRVPGMEAFFASRLGVPYPFSTAGGIVVPGGVGYALETQSKPIYASSANPLTWTGPSRETIAHETAHQWLGNHTTLTGWNDIWLNEGPTEFMAWLWSAAADGGASLDARWNALYAAPPGDSSWTVPPAAPPSANEMFDGAMYDRGAMTMIGVLDVFEATYGDGPGTDRFFAVLKDHLTAPGHALGTATTASLIAMVKAADPGRDARWDEYFRQWLYTSGKPSMTPANFATYTLP
jgi:aminopeptidase N